MEEAGFVKEVAVAACAGFSTPRAGLSPSWRTRRSPTCGPGCGPPPRITTPVLGHGPVAGLTFATAHGRKGVLHAPLTAAVVTDVVTGAAPRVDLAPFSYARLTA